MINDFFRESISWLGYLQRGSVLIQITLFILALWFEPRFQRQIKAPIQKDQKLANLIVLNKDEVIKSIPLYSLKKISKVNFFKSLFTSLNYLIWGDV